MNLGIDCALLGAASVAATMDRSWLATALVLAVAAGAWLVGSRVLRHYDAGRAQQGLLGDLALTSLLALGATCAVALAGVTHLAEHPSVARFVLVLLPTTVWARVMVPGVRALSAEEPDLVLVVGSGPLGRHTGLAIVEAARHVTGYLSLPGDAAPSRLPAPLLGACGDLERVLSERPVSEVYLAGHSLADGDAMQSAIRVCERFGVPFALPASPFRLDRARPAEKKAIDDGYIHFLSYERHPVQMRVKRLFDIVASAAALALLAPLLVAVSVLVKLTSAGPVLFKQERVGQHGRPFYMLKFRSMVQGADALKAKLAGANEQSGPVFKMKQDPRVTRIGRFIRKFSIDELPQLVNVLRGEMSIVGPRPPVPQEVAKYEAWQRRRLSVRPGLTCVWQVSGRNEISFESWMYLDMQYIDHWSLKEDFLLILKTVPVVLTGRGAS
jgi:exopolysaccharide biosynthesis polyprenyl glycosylphosphotransferase